jgi:hypothetical protein
MARITVQVWDATGNERQEVELPDDLPIERILAVLAEKKNVPQTALEQCGRSSFPQELVNVPGSRCLLRGVALVISGEYQTRPPARNRKNRPGEGSSCPVSRGGG